MAAKSCCEIGNIGKRYCVWFFTFAEQFLLSTKQAVMCLTEAFSAANYSQQQHSTNCDLNSMSNKYTESESPVVTLKNESSRQRWELFHRAIAHAKQSNAASLAADDCAANDPRTVVPRLSIVR
jgi:hypothetical protein